jgi:hypothetical protein
MIHTVQIDLEDSECEEIQDASKLKDGQEVTLMGQDDEISDVSSVSSSDDSSD